VTGRRRFGTGSSKATNIQQYPYYLKNGSLKSFNGTAFEVDNVTTAPPFKAGEVIMYRDPTTTRAVSAKPGNILLDSVECAGRDHWFRHAQSGGVRRIEFR